MSSENFSLRRELVRLAAGLLAADVLCGAVFALIGHWDYTVATGLLWGTLAALLNFFLLGLTMQKAAQSEQNPKKVAQVSYGLRMLLLAAILAAGILLPWFHAIAVVIPVLLQTPVLLILSRLNQRK